MVRFTEKLKDGKNIIREGIQHVFCSGVGTFFDGEAVDKLAEYEDLEEQGKLLKLHCSVGETVYYPDDYYGIVDPVKISEIIIGELNTVQYIGCSFDGNGDPEAEYDFEIKDFGKTVFHTKEEAEAALKKMNETEE